MPEFFTDELLKGSSHWTLSTSQVVGDLFDVYGWGAVVPDGYGASPLNTIDACREADLGSKGMAYLIRSESLQFTVTSKSGLPSDELIKNLDVAACSIMDLLQQQQQLQN